jgi:hypothetical protein
VRTSAGFTVATAATNPLEMPKWFASFASLLLPVGNGFDASAYFLQLCRRQMVV